MQNHLFDLIRSRAPGDDRTFIERHDGSLITYGDMWTLTGRMANALRTLGVQQGDRVAVQVEKSPEVIVLALACARAGAIFLPLNAAYTAAEIEYFLGDAEPALFVCDPGRQVALTPVAVRCGVRKVETLDADGKGSLSDLAASAPAPFENAACGPDDLAAILYTSGTTGRSKGAMLSHDNLASNALTLAEYWRFTRDDVLIHALPVFHTHGLFVATNTILMAGASMIFLPKFDPAQVMALATARDEPDGRAHLLHPPARLSRSHAGGCGRHAAVRIGIRAAAGRDASRIQGPYGPRDPRALRHDRDEHEHLQPV